MKNKHRIKQGLSLLLAGGIALTNLGAALPAFAEDAPATPETAEATTPETAETNVPTPNLSQITENLYADLPDAPTGSYLGSMGLPVATGETKIGMKQFNKALHGGSFLVQWNAKGMRSAWGASIPFCVHPEKSALFDSKRWASGIRQKQSRHASCIHEATALMLKIHQQSNMAVCAAGRSLAAS